MYVYEDNKKFWVHPDGILERCHDDNFQGMRFRHKRCPYCNRITSIHSLHWLNHIKPCSGDNYANCCYLDMRYKPISEIYLFTPGQLTEDRIP